MGKIVSLLIFVAVVAFSAVSRAGDSNDTQKEKRAENIYMRAVEAYKERDFPEARDGFKEAMALRPSWKIWFNIAQCEASLKRHGLALEAFERYLSEGGDDVPESRQKEVLEELERLRKMVGVLKVVGSSGDVVFVNDVQRQTLPSDGGIRVAMGQVHVRVLRGQEPVLERTADIYGGETTELVARGSEPEGEAGREAEASTARGDEEHQRVWAWVALGLGAAVGIAGGVVGGVALSEKKDFMSECEDNTCPPSRKSDQDRIGALSLSADILYGVAAAATVTAILLFVFEPDVDTEEGAYLVPSATDHGAGITVGGSF